MVLCLKEILKILLKMVKDYSDGLMDNIMKAISKMNNLMVMENIIGLMVEYIKENGIMVIFKDREQWNIQMEEFIQVRK